MSMLLKISWRNIWRQKRRSMIVMASIIVGTAAVLLFDSISMGFIMQQLNNEIKNDVGHFQINKKGYSDNKILANRIANFESIEKILQKKDFIKVYSKRIITFGMLSSAENSAGAVLEGIEPNQEPGITSIKSFIREGEYLSNNPHDIVISKAMSKKLNVELGDKIVMMAAASDGSIQSELYRVKGIFKSNDNEFDKTHIYVTIQSAQNLLKTGNAITQFAITVDNIDKIDVYKKEIVNAIDKQYEVLSYKDILPLLVYYIEISIEMMALMYVFIAIAILFSIINTMLMSVFERIQEFGVLMSMGMRNKDIFIMIMQESFLIGVLGTIIGFAVGFALYLYFAYNGINLSGFSESLESWGVGTVIYPLVDLNVVYRTLFIIPLTTIIGAIYPAIKAIRLQPTDAMRYI
jgi:ABC-type lipoprotein release transport system permease subunit